MKKVKKIFVFSDGSCYIDYNIITSIKLKNVVFKKNDYKNSSLYNKNLNLQFVSKHSKQYKKKFFYNTKNVFGI